MNTDLTMLTASAILTGLLVGGKGIAMWLHWPAATVLGNRETPPPLPAWAGRADRAHHNMLENFSHFAVFVLVANFAGLANAQTALGATVFFWARVAHAITYLGGFWRVRWLAFFAGVGGEFLIVARVVSAPPWRAALLP